MEGNMRAGMETILVAEDEPAMRELVSDILDSGGYKVIAVEDGEAAVRTYSEMKDDIDLVILDMNMPKMNGAETFRKLRTVNREILVLLSSGFSHDVEDRELLREGLSGFLQKPYQVGEYLEKVGAVLQRTIGDKDLAHLMAAGCRYRDGLFVSDEEYSPERIEHLSISPCFVLLFASREDLFLKFLSALVVGEPL